MKNDIAKAIIMIKEIANRVSFFSMFVSITLLLLTMDVITAGGSGGKSSENSENTESDQKWNYCKVVYCETCNDHRCQTKTCPSQMDDCRSFGISLATSFITIGLGLSMNLIAGRLHLNEGVEQRRVI